MKNTQVAATAVVTDRPVGRGLPAGGLPEISGYQLIERIGLGGYGEVWRAVGPGGFPKAVKILYGQIDGPQAETELKSLNLMRELRHPFLLNVERVEFVNGKLIVVTELADRGLDQRFHEAVRAGARGIPREELIAYLRDVADALDFMSEHHGLQHLDIKPENLLIQGNHAKVGDFGLTKSVGLTNVSMVNGFTPLYAPPELFEGQPSSNSDQYSLAIVYQMMLTGIPPFNGRTAAHLTSQHLRGTPDLTALPMSDRGIVARALSRNPATRFSGCRMFIDELAKRKASTSSTVRALNADAAMMVSGLTQTVDPASVGKSASTPLRPAKPLPPLPAGAVEETLRPTLFIAVGGLGVQIACRLFSKIKAGFENAVPPTFAFLCLDSDKSGLAHACRLEGEKQETLLQQLPIPLKSPQEYRKSASSHLGWISRRWLFNIPRSGQVEGMRPLGRLVFVDHEAEIRTAVAKQLKAIISPAAIAASVTGTQRQFATGAVDVCLIGSTAGGTSSGSLIDLALLIRKILDRSSLRESQISGMLLHSTSVGGQKSDAQDANSVSFLKELHYFSLPGAQVPNTDSSVQNLTRPPFDTAHFVHLGDDLTSSDFERHVEFLSDYLHSWSASSERGTLQGWRDTEQKENDRASERTLRTLGYASIDGTAWNLATSESESLALRVLGRWIDGVSSAGFSLNSGTWAASAPGSPAMSEIHNLLESLGLNNEQVAESIPGLLRGDVSRRLESYSADVWNRVSALPSAVSDLAGLVSALATMISADTTPGASSHDSVSRITQTVRQELNARLQQAISRIQNRLFQDMDTPQRLQRAAMTLSTCLSRLDAAIASCSAQKADVQQTFASLCSSFLQSDDGQSEANSTAALKGFCQQYCMLLICQTVCQCMIGYLTSLREHIVRQQTETLAGFRSRLLELAAILGRASADAARVPGEVVDSFEMYLQTSGQFRVSALLRSTDSVERHGALIAADATNFLISATGTARMDSKKTARRDRENFPADAHPVLSNVGGGRRVLARIPSSLATESWRPRLQAEFGDCVSIHQASRQEVSVVCEVEDIGIPTIVDSLTHLRPRVVEMSERLHCRTDISF